VSKAEFSALPNKNADMALITNSEFHKIETQVKRVLWHGADELNIRVQPTCEQ
jgi:hypothetical protein